MANEKFAIADEVDIQEHTLLIEDLPSHHPFRVNFDKQQRRRRRHRLWFAFTAVALFTYCASSFYRANEIIGCKLNSYYPNESIQWTPCGQADGYPAECSTINVPMDQFNASNSGDKTFEIPLIRIRGNNATENMLVNPGGPGGSGIEFVHRAGQKLKEVVGENYHILSFDPRGVNSSRPAALCFENDQERAAKMLQCTPDALKYSPDTNAWASTFTQGCSDNVGEHGKYINTPQTAADMNSILDAVGQEDLAYWGFSYGTTLGQTYASLFPERSKRVIIDGVSDLFRWYGKINDPTSLADSDNVFHGFFKECIKARHECALYKPGFTAEKLEKKVMDVIDSLEKEPLEVYHNSTIWGVLNRRTVLTSIFPLLYKPQKWYPLAQSLNSLVQGNGTDFLLNYGLQPPYPEKMGEHLYFVSLNDKGAGRDLWPQKEELIDYVKPYFNTTIFALDYSDFYVTAQWRNARTHPLKLKKNVKTKHPLLILTQTYDPVCPLRSARVALNTFEDSRLVEVEGYGHCSIAIHSTCSNDIAREYLLHGTLPNDKETKCATDKPYFVSPEKQEEIKLKAAMKGASADDRSWAAQMELSDHIHGLVRF